LSLGGELRERFEAIDHDNFGIQTGSDSFLLQRIELLADLHLGSHVRGFVSGISGLVWGKTSPHLQFKMTPLICYSRSLRQRLM